MGKFFKSAPGKIGWITEVGKFIECDNFEHEKVAKEISGKDIQEIEKLWIRISELYGNNHVQFQGKHLTKRQEKALESWGLFDFMHEQKGSVLLDANLISIYLGGNSQCP